MAVVPPTGGMSAPAGSAGQLLRLIREGVATTRSELASVTGLARSTVWQRVDGLIGAGYVYEAGQAPSTGGRPPKRLAFNERAGVVLAADLGATHCRVALCDLDGGSLAEVADDLAIAEGPATVLDWLDARFHELLELAGHDDDDVRAIGIGVPGPVEHATGQPVSPPIMPGWDGYVIPDHFADRFDLPILVDNDVNIMARGEYWANWRQDVGDLLFIKVGTGIGCGIVASGQIHHGAQGAAGDLGHIRVADTDEVICRCGNVGCVEAIAGGAALAGQLRQAGFEAEHSRDVVRLVRAGEVEAARLVREAGRRLGEVLAAAVNLFNPAVIVIGGDVAHAHEHLLAGVREVVYQRSLPLATRHLEIVRSSLDDRAGITGAAVMAIERILDPVHVNAVIEGDDQAPAAVSGDGDDTENSQAESV